MRNFDVVKPMASFLPGVGGLWGIPMWAYYVNRGQGMAAFGVKDKQHGILQFKSAEKAYQNTPFLGFRTLLKGKRASGTTFESQPFFPTTSNAAAPSRDMFIGNNEMEIMEMDPATGMRTQVVYFTAPNEEFPVLVRRVTLTNEGRDAVALEVVDGLAMLEPEGTTIEQINTLGRTLEGWMSVYNFEKEHTKPFFHLRTAAADTADVKPIEEGHFAIAFMEDGSGGGAAHELLQMICDQQLIFGTDTTLAVPRRFFSSSQQPGGTPLADLLASPQSTTSRTPSAFAAASLRLGAGESKTFSVVYGYAPNVDTFEQIILPKLQVKGYISAKRQEAQELGVTLTERVAMQSSQPLMDGYVKQNYLDNLLRGGMPVSIGDDKGRSGSGSKIFHAFSRIHGDLERDYNNFTVDMSYFSQGPGNFRDVNQNRRCDVLQLPSVHDFNVRQFLSYVQADGYNQLTVATAFFHIAEQGTVKAVASRLAPAGAAQDALVSILSKPFRPGQLFTELSTNGIKLAMGREALLNLVTKYAKQVPAGKYEQNGFWTDHFTYHLDLVRNFIAVYPDQKVEMLYDSEEVPFFLSAGRVANRTEKNMVASGDRVRQYDAVVNSAAKLEQLEVIRGAPGFVGDLQAGGTWQRTASGETMTVSIVAKLVVLAANKFAIMDPLGMGLEMEAGKPGWNDAMNGLPALFGSEMPSAYELHEIVEFVGGTIDEAGRAVELPGEVAALLTSIDAQLGRLAAGSSTDFEYWDKVHDALESYRFATDATFTGRKVRWTSAALGCSSGVFGRMLARLDQGIARALEHSPDPAKALSPSYFKYKVSQYSKVGATSSRGFPTIAVKGFDAPEPLPLFLEGPTRHLKTLRKAGRAAKLAVYEAVKASNLHDKELQMYKISESLKELPFEVGRMMAFNAGWLENESIWLHMSYKWYLEVCRALPRPRPHPGRPRRR